MEIKANTSFIYSLWIFNREEPIEFDSLCFHIGLIAFEEDTDNFNRQVVLSVNKENLLRVVRCFINSHEQYLYLKTGRLVTFKDSSALSQSLSCAKMVNFAYAIVIVIFWVESELRPTLVLHH